MGSDTKDEGPVKIEGGTTPSSFPHICPYHPKGADRKTCDRYTSNYQRNRAACGGSNDHRNIPPCNSELRRCIICLAEGRGAMARYVTDVEKGMCTNHKALAESLSAARPAFPGKARRLALQIPDYPPQPRKPWFNVAPSAPLDPLQSVAVVTRIVSISATLGARGVRKKLPTEPPVETDELARRISLLTPRKRHVLRTIVENNDDEAAKKLLMTAASILDYLAGARDTEDAGTQEQEGAGCRMFSPVR